MARPVKIYRWDDVGAPQRSPSDAASIVNILKKCLVEGYGSKDPLGWTLEYEDAPNAIAVFRNSPVNGSGGVVRVSPYNIPTNAYIFTQSAQAATGTAVADLFNPGYRNSIPTDSNFTRWILVGDDRSFYFILHHTTSNFNTTTPEVSFFCGDIDSAIPTDVARFICTGSNANSTTSVLNVSTISTYSGPLNNIGNRNSVLNGSLSGDNTRGKILLPTTVSGVLSALNYSFYVAGETGSSFPNGIVNNTDWPAGATLQPVAIKRDEPFSVANMSDVDAPYIRGYMPGLITPIFRTHHGATWPVIQDIDGKDHLGVAIFETNSNYGGIRLWINTEDWG